MRQGARMCMREPAESTRVLSRARRGLPRTFTQLGVEGWKASRSSVDICSVRHPVLLLFLVLFACNSCAQPGPWWPITVGTFADADSFAVLNSTELRFDSLGLGPNGLPFRENRSRWVSYLTKQGKTIPMDHGAPPGIPMPCDCRVHQDTLQVKSIIGFFGGGGILTILAAKQAQPLFVEWIDDVDIYRTLADTTWRGIIEVECAHATVRLNEEPSYLPGQQLQGLLEYTTVPFMQKTYELPDTLMASGSLRFMCTTVAVEERRRR